MSHLASTHPEQAEPSMALLVATTVVTTFAVTVSLVSFLNYTLWPKRPKIIEGPLHSVVARLPKHELDKLNYKPDAFPGARDVSTPYGCIRVYEWGPEDGPKVLMIHGISTSCQTLSLLANALVEKGCRVMLFDLFGRGFSDGVGDVPHDARLYTSQALLALASSPLAWTGDGALRVVGYSMGGGIAVHFAGAFPRMVSSLVLLAPAGLIRAENFGTVTRYIFTSGVVPTRILGALTARRLRKPIAAGSKKKGQGKAAANGNGVHAAEAATKDRRGSIDPIGASLAEVSGPAGTTTPLEKRVLEYVQWMVKHHQGFIPAFCGSVAEAPLIGQEEAYAKLALRETGTTAVILGEIDEIIDPTDYAADALPLAGGREKVHWTVIPGGAHDFPMTHARETLRVIYKLWDLEA